jgi:hypothetical protein
MKHPYIANANANIRLNQMLQDAENHRMVKNVSGQNPGSKFLSDLKDRIPILKGQRMDESAGSPA